MKTELDQVEDWLDQGKQVVLATVVSTWGSSPRPVGAVMAISDQSEISGSVSGGCVEGAVIDAGLEVIQTGEPRRLHFGVADENAWQVGLSCGGEIEIYVEPFGAEELAGWRNALQLKAPFCKILVLKGDLDVPQAGWFVFEPGSSGVSETGHDIPEELHRAAQEACLTGKSALLSIPAVEYPEVFLHVYQPPQRLIVVGGVHIAIPLVSLANTLGYEVILIDPRRLFGTRERFPGVTRLLQEWPQEAFLKVPLTSSTAVVTLTHDPKIDDPALLAALDSPAYYIGALGSRRTHQNRVKRLLDQGLDPGDLERIHAPVGLDLGGTAPEEIALAVMAEIVQCWHSQG